MLSLDMVEARSPKNLRRGHKPSLLHLSARHGIGVSAIVAVELLLWAAPLNLD
jgi:hypothetical protein